jgi:hypothetical protein
MIHKRSEKDKGWLILFYSIPSRPVSNRMKVWRRLVKAGAVPLKGSVYILPLNDEHYEFCQWLVSEVTSMGGDGAFVQVSEIETIKEKEIINLFNNNREGEYKEIEKELDTLERKLSSIKKGGKGQDLKALSEELNRYFKDYEEIKRIDFFSSKVGRMLGRRIKAMETEIKSLSGLTEAVETTLRIPQKNIEDYQKKIWVTRKGPFVDRMSSAWLIKRFIDKNASFGFIDEKDVENLGKDRIPFDIRGGEFTHMGDMCTFEVIIKAFALKDKALKKMAEIVHELDIKDDRYKNPEAKGIEEILIGIRKTARNDTEALEKGIAVFEMFYESRA